MTHVSVDIETWGKTPGSDIRSIGACVFDLQGVIREVYYIALENPVDPGQIRTRYPLTRDPGTEHWWSEQSVEAQSAFSDPVDMLTGLNRFATWLNMMITRHGGTEEELRLWMNGSHFDEPILAAAYRACGLPVPWHYRSPRDMRTLCDIAGLTRGEFIKPETAHHALHDAIAQARTIVKAYGRVKP